MAKPSPTPSSSGPNLDQVKVRAFQLGMKKSTQGLTTEEENELALLNRQLDLQKARIGQ